MVYIHYARYNILLYITTIFALLLALSAGIESVHAQELGVRLQPVTIEDRLDPGEVMRGNLTVTNQSIGTQTYYISTKNIVAQEDSGRPIFAETNNTDPNELAAWIVPEITTVTLEEGESTTVPDTITVPEDASPGSHFAGIIVTREPDRATESGAGVGFQVVSVATLRVNGDVVEGIAVREFSTDQFVYNNEPVQFSVVIANTGTVHQRPVGVVTLTDMLGNDVEIEPLLKLNENAGVVMPNKERKFSATWQSEHFMIGRYTATLSTIYGETNRTTVSNVTIFWVFPVKQISIFLGSIILLIIVTMLALRAYVKRALRRAGLPANSHEPEVDRLESFSKRLVRTLAWLALIVGVVFIGVVVFFA